jgi:hypothetical protein
MSIAKVSEIISSSSKSFEDAVQEGIKRANKTLENVSEAWIKGEKGCRRKRARSLSTASS